LIRLSDWSAVRPERFEIGDLGRTQIEQMEGGEALEAVRDGESCSVAQIETGAR